MRRTLNGPRRLVSLPSIVFALSFVLLGWIASHSIAYALIGLVQHGHHEHHHAEEHIHGYMSVLKLMGGIGLVLAFTFALRAFFRHGTFGEWLRDSSLSAISKQLALATVLPAAVFVFVEHLERLLAGTGTYPSVLLLAVGVLAQLVVGLVCLALVRVTLRIAERVIHSITRRRLVPVVRGATSPVVESVLFVRSRCPMADSAAGRAPPLSFINPG